MLGKDRERIGKELVWLVSILILIEILNFIIFHTSPSIHLGFLVNQSALSENVGKELIHITSKFHNNEIMIT